MARADPRVVLLGDGQGLIAGGVDASFGRYSCAQLFNPAAGMWSVTGSMKVQRASFVLQKLLNGEVLAAGGCHAAGNCASLTATAELYDPKTGTWSSTGSMPAPREGASWVLFPAGPLAGKVLVAGGCCNGRFQLASALLYNPSTGRWSATSSMHAGRIGSAMTLLPSGKVLVSGGDGAAGNQLASAELYNPATRHWTLTGSMHDARWKLQLRGPHRRHGPCCRRRRQEQRQPRHGRALHTCHGTLDANSEHEGRPRVGRLGAARRRPIPDRGRVSRDQPNRERRAVHAVSGARITAAGTNAAPFGAAVPDLQAERLVS